MSHTPFQPKDAYAVITIGFDLKMIVPKHQCSEVIDLLCSASIVANNLVLKEEQDIGFQVTFVKGAHLNEVNGITSTEAGSFPTFGGVTLRD